MSTSYPLATALLLTTALSAPAFAQTSDPVPAAPQAGQPAADPAEEVVDISGPGASAAAARAAGARGAAARDGSR